MKSKRNMQDMVIQNQTMLERLKSQMTRENQIIISSEMTKVFALIASLRIDNFSQFNKREMQKFLKRVLRVVDTGTALQVSHLNKYLKEISGNEAFFTAAAISATSNVARPKALKRRAYKTAVNSIMSATGTTLSPYIKGWTNNQRGRAKQVIQRGWKEGWTVSRMLAAFKGTAKTGFKDGLEGIEKRNARTVLHTATQHTANAAYQDTWRNNSSVIVGYEWLSTLDSKTSTVCRGLDGRIFEVDSGPVPPIHPNCRSSTIPKLAPDLEYLEDGRTRASSEGPVLADMKYYDWLKEQPLEFQESAIGEGKAALLNDGSLTADQFSKLSLDRNFQPLTLAEMRSEQSKIIARQS